MNQAQYIKEHHELTRRLISARHHAKLKQTDAAQLLGMTQSNLSLLESGKRRLDAVDLIAFARAYKKPVHFFYE